MNKIHLLFVPNVSVAKDKVEESDPLMKLFYYGSEKTDILANIEMKHFFYVNIGLVGWAMLDLLMILNAVQEGNATKPGIFIFATQLLYIGHTIYFEVCICILKDINTGNMLQQQLIWFKPKTLWNLEFDILLLFNYFNNFLLIFFF